MAWETKLVESVQIELRNKLDATKKIILPHANAILSYSKEIGSRIDENQEDSIKPELDKIIFAAQTLKNNLNRIDQFHEFSSTHTYQESLEYIKNLRHDILSCLNAIKGYNEIIQEKLRDSNCEDVGCSIVISEIARQIIKNADEMKIDKINLSASATLDSDELIKNENNDTNAKHSILVVDDTKLNRDLLSDWLAHKNYHVFTAENGEKAIALLKKEESIDLILLDIMMPVMDGYQVLKYIKNTEEFKHIPIIMISALDEIDSIVRCIKEGAEDYLIKPFNSFLLSARVSACVEKKELRDLEKVYTEQLIEEKNYIESIISAMNNMLIVTDKDLNIQSINPATVNALKYQEKELIGKSMRVIFADKSEYEKLSRQVYSEGNIKNIERIFVTKDGSKIPALFSFSSIISIHHKFKNFICVAQNISEIKEIQKQLFLLSHQAGMAEVAVSVLHNIGNVLNSVNVSIGMIRSTIQHNKLDNLQKIKKLIEDNSDEFNRFFVESSKGAILLKYIEELAGDWILQKEYFIKEVENLEKNFGHIKNIVARQQAFSHSRVIEEVMSIQDLLEDAISISIDEVNLTRLNIQLIRKYQPTPPVLMDKIKLTQILINIIQNAVDALQVTNIDNKEITFVLKQKSNDTLLIQIIDNGIGIEKDNLKRIFTYGFTTKLNGHGFGLHTSALAVKDLHGEISVFSEGAGKGAIFTLELPINYNQ